jgi:hypothetical protein
VPDPCSPHDVVTLACQRYLAAIELDYEAARNQQDHGGASLPVRPLWSPFSVLQVGGEVGSEPAVGADGEQHTLATVDAVRELASAFLAEITDGDSFPSLHR